MVIKGDTRSLDYGSYGISGYNNLVWRSRLIAEASVGGQCFSIMHDMAGQASPGRTKGWRRWPCLDLSCFLQWMSFTVLSIYIPGRYNSSVCFLYNGNILYWGYIGIMENGNCYSSFMICRPPLEP